MHQEKPSDVEAKFPCVRGCHWETMIEDEEPRPKAANHGTLCDSCFYRLKSALEMIPDLMANMRAQVEGVGVSLQTERVSGGGDGSPAPLRIAPLDASDSLFAKLVSWTEVIGGELNTPQPSVAVWMNFREIQGMRGPVTPEKAHELSTQLTEWFLVRLEQIAALDIASTIHDDICYGWEDARGVFSLSAAYGVGPGPLRPAEERGCPGCGKRGGFLKFPDSFDPEIAVLCGRCKWVAEPENYDFYARLFR